uniref:Uncharacterized protein n=1 Tax=Cacopsylla melanoneura TaxID=428564 RepID=A0A8D8QMD7_9HEMI
MTAILLLSGMRDHMLLQRAFNFSTTYFTQVMFVSMDPFKMLFQTMSLSENFFTKLTSMSHACRQLTCLLQMPHFMSLQMFHRSITIATYVTLIFCSCMCIDVIS